MTKITSEQRQLRINIAETYRFANLANATCIVWAKDPGGRGCVFGLADEFISQEVIEGYGNYNSLIQYEKIAESLGVSEELVENIVHSNDHEGYNRTQALLDELAYGF